MEFHPEYNPIDREAECSTLLPSGLRVVCPAYPGECTYVRFVDNNGFELGYWDHQEWADDPTDVMGAIMGLMSQEEGLPDTSEYKQKVWVDDLVKGDVVLVGGKQPMTVVSVEVDTSKSYHEVSVTYDELDEPHLYGEDRVTVVRIP